MAAGAGASVAKHGNRSISSRVGSADVLSACGVAVELEPEPAGRVLDEVGLVFLFAPAFHPAMKELGTVRRELGVRTIFNALGPLANPAGARRQLIGVGRPELVRLLADALASLGAERAIVFHSANGLDEFVPGVDADGVEVREGWTRPWKLDRSLLPRQSVAPEELAGGDADENARNVEGPARREQAGPRREAVLWNAAVALTVEGSASDVADGYERAAHAIDSGAALGAFRKAARGKLGRRGSAGMTDVLARIVADKRTRLDRGEYSASARDAAIRVGRRAVSSPRCGSPACGSSPRSSTARRPRGRSSRARTARSRPSRSPTAAGTRRRSPSSSRRTISGGQPEWLPRARRIAGLPALWKDFVVSARQVELAASLGADAILLIARILTDAELAALSGAARELGMAVVIEAHDAAEIARAAAATPDVLGVNARDLSSFATRLETLEALASGLPKGPVRLAESGIHGPADIAKLRHAGYEAFLVGEALLRSEDPEGALRELRAKGLRR